MKKVLLVFVALIMLLVAAIAVLPYFFKDDVVSYLKNETVKGRLEFDEDISIGLISSFPDLNVAIRNIKVINAAPFEGDTLAALKELNATIDLIQIINGNIEVKSINVIEPKIKVIVKADGTANYDIALESEEEPSEEEESTEDDAYSFKISSFTISNGHIEYLDTSLLTYTTLQGFNFDMSGEFNEENMTIENMIAAESFDLDFEGVKYISNAKMSYNADMILHLNDEKYDFLENELLINELGLAFDGTFAFVGEDMDFDLTYGLTKTDFKSLLSMVPAIYASDFDGLQANGNVDFHGHLKGLMTEIDYPEFSFVMNIEDGAFKYPDLPTALNNTQVKLDVTNPGGIFDKTVVKLSKCHFDLDKEPFDMTLLLKNPDTDPYLETELNGKLNLANVATLLPLEGVNKLAGIIEPHLKAKGNMSAIENEQYEDFYAAGTLQITEFAYADNDLPDEVDIPDGRFSFDPHYAAIENLDIILGKSDLNFKGKVENYLPYVFHNQTIKGELSLTGQILDLNPWITEEATEESETTAEEETEDDYEFEVVEIPANINFVFNTLLKEVHFENYDMTNFKGEVSVQDQILSFKELGLNMLGGGVVMDGSYNTQNVKKPTSDFSFKLQNVSIPGMYQTFMTIQELMPIAGQLNGDVSGFIRLNSNLQSDLMPELESVNGKAKLSIDKVELEGNKIWNKAVDYIGWGEDAKKLVISKVKPSFNIVDGDIYLDTFDFKIRGQEFDFGGKSSLNQTVDYALDTKVPAKAVSSSAETLISELSKNKVNVDLADEIDIRFMITGEMEDPDFKPVVMGADGKAFSVKDAAKNEAKKIVEEGKEKAIGASKEELKKQAAKLKDEAELLRKQAKKLKKEAADFNKKAQALKAESDKLRKEADAQKAKIEKEMANVPKPIREKAMEKVDVLFEKANSKLDEANKYFELAKKPEQKADELLKKADALEKQAEDILND
ncbi:MAG: AsmA family protein [Bacteroidia bacterium]